MLGLNKGSDSAPPYEEVEAGQHAMTGYASVPQDDAHDAPESAHNHQYMDRNASNLPAPSTFQPHVHCEACDGFLERQQKMRSERFCCAMVTATFMVAFVCILLLGSSIANARKDKWNH
ncbi:uncharacterized protein BJX67DRAFT_381086 [Aspergillus lucknowensis]|uniref:LITAF domain-containing protein n=1 Tax=Aspergillus lucknowensis TaxID=176173 RepID=A0ABR4LTC2_9EURO